MHAAFVVHRGAKDLAHLFFHAAAKKSRAPLELDLHVFIEPAYHQLGHEGMISIEKARATLGQGLSLRHAEGRGDEESHAIVVTAYRPDQASSLLVRQHQGCSRWT
jgi:hypothetical protein